jgi:hypothetical protein
MALLRTSFLEDLWRWLPSRSIKRILEPRAAQGDLAMDGFDKEGKVSMADDSEFLIPSAILASAVVAKSELVGEELVKFAANIHRRYVNAMQLHREAQKKEP